MSFAASLRFRSSDRPNDEQKRCAQQGYMLFATTRDAAYDQKD